MAFRTASSDFEKVFGQEKTMTEQFMDKLMEYLETRKLVTPFKEIYERLLQGKPLSSFGCRYDISEDLTELLGENDIPCIKVLAPNGKIGFITSSDDDEAVADIQKQLLKMLGRYMPVYSGKKLRSMIDGKKKMSVLSISGLTTEEVLVMRNQCAKETGITAVGIDRMSDDTYKFSVFADEAIKKGQKDLTLAQIYIKMKLMIQGPYRDVMMLRASRQEKYEEFVSAGFDLQTYNNGHPVTLIGEGNEYVRITQDGMQYGHYEMKDGSPEYKEEAQAPKMLPNYSTIIASYTSRLVNPIIAKDVHELSAALKAPDLSVNHAELHASMAEKAIMSHIAGLLEAKKEYDPVMRQSGEYDKKFIHQVEKSRVLLISSVTGEYPHEYSTREQKDFQAMLEKNGVDMRPYMDVLKDLKATEVLIEKKDIDLIKDMSGYTVEIDQEKSAPSREELGL